MGRERWFIKVANGKGKVFHKSGQWEGGVVAEKCPLGRGRCCRKVAKVSDGRHNKNCRVVCRKSSLHATNIHTKIKKYLKNLASITTILTVFITSTLLKKKLIWKNARVSLENIRAMMLSCGLLIFVVVVVSLKQRWYNSCTQHGAKRFLLLNRGRLLSHYMFICNAY